MLCLFILLSIIQNIVHQKIIKYIVENSILQFLWGFKMHMKIASWLWEFGYLALKMFRGSCGNFFKGACTNPVSFRKVDTKLHQNVNGKIIPQDE